jgi:zinc D-Ala-D-Ala carboxypeptidase
MTPAFFLVFTLLVPDIETIPHRNRDAKHIFLQTEAAHAYKEMAAAAAHEGIELIPISGYRSKNEQTYLYKKFGPKRAAPPGSSYHEKGLAVDFTGIERFISNEDINYKNLKQIERTCTSEQLGWKCPTITYWWLYSKAEEFGFHQTVETELWHWEFKKPYRD